MISSYIRTHSVSEAVEALQQNLPWGRIIAGGTDMLSKTMNTRYKQSKPLVYIDIKRIEELKGIRMAGNELVIGPAVTLRSLMDNDLVQEKFPVLAQAAAQVGSKEIRNRATVGGNIGSKSSNADLLVPLIGLGAKLEVCDIEGRRDMLLEDLLGSGLTGLGRRMIITAIKVPVGELTACGYRRWSRESMGRAFLSTMVGLKNAGQTGTCQVVIVAGGTGFWPRRYEETVSLAVLSDSEAGMVLIKRALEAKPGNSNISTSEYQQQLLEVLVNEALNTAGKEIKP